MFELSHTPFTQMRYFTMNDILFNIRPPPLSFFPFPLSIRCHAGGKIVKLVSVFIVNITVQNINCSSESILKRFRWSWKKEKCYLSFLFTMTWLHCTCIGPSTRCEHLLYTVADQTFSIFYHTVTNISETLFIEDQ